MDIGLTLRSLLFAFVFYVNTALFLVLGAPLLLGPRRWAMMGLEAHARASMFWQRLIVGTDCEVRGLDNLPKGPALDTARLVATIQRRAPVYDKAQESHYNLISALHKSLRGSDTDAALYWLARMLAGG